MATQGPPPRPPESPQTRIVRSAAELGIGEPLSDIYQINVDDAERQRLNHERAVRDHNATRTSQPR